MIVVDASVVLAASGEHQQHRQWAVTVIEEGAEAPHLMPVEVCNALRRLEATGQLSRRAASSALADAITIAVNLWPFAPFADRVWQLRGAVSAYDAWYVALAETLDAPLATLDRRLVASKGPRCQFLTP